MPISDTSITFYGMIHLVGKEVQACIGGLDCGVQTVGTSGEVTVAFGADPQGLFTAAYLFSLDGYDGEQAATIQFYYDSVLRTITAPVVIGMAYVSRGQVLRAAVQADLRLQTTNGLGLTRRSHGYAALLQNTGVGALSFGTDFVGTMDAADLREPNGEDAWPATELYSGVHHDVLNDGYSFDSMLCWEVTAPLPATVCAVTAFVVAAEE